jgi:Fe-Mn family superoxide dismutase
MTMSPSGLPRRSFLASTAALAAAPIAPAALAALAQTSPPTSTQAAPAKPAPATGPFVLEPLPYAFDALEPAIDARTMELHHGKHHGVQVTNLNAAVAGLSIPTSVEALIADLAALPADKRTAIRNNGGGHANHALFWKVLAPKGAGGEPSKALAAAIERDLGGSFDAMKAEVTKAALGRFGSGWAWIVVTPEKKLAVTSTANQDNPLMGPSILTGPGEIPGTPIFGIDVWEHAYYLNYQNRRGDYLKALWDIVHWTEVSRRYEAAIG